MKTFTEHNFIAYTAVKEGQIVAVDVTHSANNAQMVIAATSANASTIIGIAGQGADAGTAVNVIPMQAGQIVHVVVTEAITAGHSLALDAAGVVDNGSGTAGEIALPLVAMEAATAANDIIAVVCVAPVTTNA